MQNANRILRPKQVREKLGVGNTWLWESVKSGLLPRPIRLGARAVGFLESEIDQFIADRVRARQNQGGASAA